MNIIQSIKKILYPYFFKEKIIFVPRSERVSGMVVLIAGATGAIGKTIVHTLHKDGACLVLLSRSIEKARNEFPELVNDKRVTIVRGNITNREDCDNAVKTAKTEYGRLDVTINATGMFLFKSIDEVTEKEWDSMMDTNVKGVFQISKASLPIMKIQKSGLIVHLGSKISHNTHIEPKRVLYATTKFAVEGFVSALRHEIKPYGIRVCCVLPGTVNTFLSLRAGHYLSPYRVAQVIQHIIALDDVDFENITFIAQNQEL